MEQQTSSLVPPRFFLLSFIGHLVYTMTMELHHAQTLLLLDCQNHQLEMRSLSLTCIHAEEYMIQCPNGYALVSWDALERTFE